MKWKDALLRTSVPLEYLVARHAHEHGFAVFGEYAYLRQSDEGTELEFSVDLWAMKSLKISEEDYWGKLHLLIECKYCYPGLNWVFARHVETSALYVDPISVFDHLCTRQIGDRGPAELLYGHLPLVFKGVELHSDNATTQSIDRGIHQLRYALPEFNQRVLTGQANEIHDSDLSVELVLPCLVTTASLRVIKPGIDLEQFQQAKALEDFTDPAEAVQLSLPVGAELDRHCDRILSDTLAKNLAIRARSLALAEIGKDNLRKLLPLSDLTISFRWSLYNVLVVNYSALRKYLAIIDRIATLFGQSLERIGRLEIAEKGATRFDTKTRIVPV